MFAVIKVELIILLFSFQETIEILMIFVPAFQIVFIGNMFHVDTDPIMN